MNEIVVAKRRGLLSLALLFFLSFAHADEFTGRVVGISDGDTISVLHGDIAVKVRLEGIDCPESHQAFGNKAKQFAAKACFWEVRKKRMSPVSDGCTSAFIRGRNGSCGLAWGFVDSLHSLHAERAENTSHYA